MGWMAKAQCRHGRKTRRNCQECIDEEREKKAYLDCEGRRIAETIGARSIYRSPRKTR